MLEANFDGLEITGNSLNQPKIRTQYGGGFRKLSPSNPHPNPQSSTQRTSSSALKTQDSQILDYISQLNIENLPDLYKQSLPDNSALLAEKQRQAQQQSVVRLYRNLYPTRRSRLQEDQEKDEEEKGEKRYAEDLWELDKKYESLPNQFIVRKEIQKLGRRYLVELQGTVKRKKYQGQFKFQELFAYFFISESNNILELTKKSRPEDLEMDIFYLWKGFLATANFKTIQRKYQKQSLFYETLQKIRKCSKFLFTLIKPPPSSSPQPSQQPQSPSSAQSKPKQPQPPQPLQSLSLNLKQLQAWINPQPKFQLSQLKQLFQINKEYTNPFSMAQNKKEKKRGRKTRSISEPVQEEEVKVFKAAPVPKSTYQDPKEKHRPEPKTTALKPFKLSQKTQAMTPQQYYQFQKQRDFKAKPLPPTTYKPYKPELLSEQQKKARAVLALQKSQYPKTMLQLEKHAELKKEKIEELAQKHKKERPKIERKGVPDYDRLHAQELVLFETLRERNKKEIKVEPFCLSVGKRKVEVEEHNFNRGVPEIHPYSPSSKPAPASRSTKKFSAYVNFRNEHEAKKALKAEQEQAQKQKQAKKKQPYRELIKTRMAEELEAHPKKQVQYDPSMPMKIKVDKEKIYREKPLLMTSSLPREEYQLPWKPIFQ